MPVKTLLIGLGGTGCKVAARVKRMINDEDPNIQCLGFDTNANETECEGLPIILTSRELVVRQYLDDVDDWREWFPDDALLKERNMIKGAGQARPLSRLAFAETISSGRIGPLQEALLALHASRGEVEPHNFRIMIVSSFAGGTGSGMFIQTALFLRKYIRENYGGEVNIRGLFSLPDLYIKKITSRDQWESMYANAYASLRELSAINRITLSPDQFTDEVAFRLDDLFDSGRDRGVAGQRPYNYIFFVDNVNARGRVLQTHEEYEQLMATATYMQMFSPMSDTGDSLEDNAILITIAGKGRPLYGSVGASKISYPYHDLVTYCGYRATSDSITDTWTGVDRMFRDADAINRKEMALNPALKPLDRNKHYVTTVEELLSEGDSKLNFIRDMIAMEIDRGGDADDTGSRRRRRGGASAGSAKIDRAADYFGKVQSFITDNIGKDADLDELAKAASVNANTMRSDLVGAVDACETALKSYYEAVVNAISFRRAAIVQTIIPDDFASALRADSEVNILRLVTTQHVVHPIAMRVLLYKFRTLAKASFDESTQQEAKLRRQIDLYFKEGYDIRETNDIVETPVGRAESERGLKRRRFKDDYKDRSKAQNDRIRRYSVNKIQSVVFADVVARVDEIIHQLERFFDNLDDIRKGLDEKAKIIETVKHADSAESAEYLCASPDDKKALYESLHFRCSDDNSDDAYDELFHTLYAEAHEALKDRQKHKKSRQTKDMLAAHNNKMGDIFMRNIVSRNIRDIAEKCADQLDIDVYQALVKAKGAKLEDIRDVINKAAEKAMPYLQHTLTRKITNLREAENIDDPQSAYTLTFWGLNPDVEAKLLEGSGLKDIVTFFRSGAGLETPEVVPSRQYSRYEISCYKAMYCMALTEIPKFSETGDALGVFYRNYAKRVNKMVTENLPGLTPHLDIRWHRRDRLPMISEAKNMADDLRAARAMWLALIYGGLSDITYKGEKALRASFTPPSTKKAVAILNYEEENKVVTYEGKGVQITQVYELYKALRLQEEMAQRFVDVFQKEFVADSRLGLANMEFTGPRARKFAKGLISKDDENRNALNMIFRFVSNARATKYEKVIIQQALDQLLTAFYGSLTEDRQAKLRRDIFDQSMFANPNVNRTVVAMDINFAFWAGDEQPGDAPQAQEAPPAPAPVKKAGGKPKAAAPKAKAAKKSAKKK